MKISYWPIVGGLTICSPAWGLDLLTMVTDSVSAHPQVKEKVHIYRQILRDEDIAQSGWRPRVDVDASSGLYRSESPSTGNTRRDYDSSRVELSLTQNLFNGYDTTYQIEQTKARARAALYDIYDSADNIALDSIQAYLDLLKQRRLYQLAIENVSSHENILAQIRDRNNSGVGRRSQLEQTEGRVARAHASLIAQGNNLQDSATILHQILGRYVDPDDLQDPVLPGLPPEDLNTLIDRALLNHPAMKVAEHNIRASLAEHSRSRSSRYPKIDLQLASEYGDDIGGISGNTEELSLVLNLNYNFYDGGESSARRQKTVSASYEQKEFSARVRRQIVNTLRLAWMADHSLTRQLTFLDTYTVKASDTVISYRDEFFIGQRDLIDLLDAENEANAAQNQYAEAYYDTLESRYRIYEGIGSLFAALNIEVTLGADNLQVAGIMARSQDVLPLPTDEDSDEKSDSGDHCDNTVELDVVNEYGCLQSGEVDLSYLKTNSVPLVGNDEIAVDSNGMIVISQKQLLANDSDADGDPLTIIDTSQPKNGQLAFDQNRNLVFRPNEGFIGTDSFIYSVSDGNGATGVATVKLVVQEVSRLDLSKVQYVNFVFRKTELTADSRAKVDAIVDRILSAKEIRIEISTHTDSIGSNLYNLDLSERRAKALKAILVSRGIDESMITAVGKGEEFPIADNQNKAGQAINRRGEFVFVAEGLE